MKIVFLTFLFLAITACSSSEEETRFQIKDLENAMEVFPMMSSIADEIEENPNFEGGESNYGNFASGQLDRTFSPCDDGIKTLNNTAEFDFVSLDRAIEHRYLQSTGFNDDDCSFDSQGIIIRSFEMKEERVDKTKIYSSADLFDYTGSLHGGGIRILRDNTSFLLEVTGTYFLEQKESVSTESISFYSIDPFRLNKLDRNSRTLASGTVVVRDNLRKKQMTLRTQSLEYSVTCCHPYKGSGSLDMDGEVLTLKFEGCGVVKAEGVLFGKATISLKACH